VPDENFSWGFTPKIKAPKAKANAEKQVITATVIKSEPRPVRRINENLKLKLSNNLEFSMVSNDKINKGLVNSKFNCFMNVCL
jgi:hypothetical protein